jgi:hypothetical protein
VIKTDALWEVELRGVLERAAAEGLFPPDLDCVAHATILARLVDGLGMRSVFGGRWDEARSALIAYLAGLGLSSAVVKELRAASS